MILNKNEAAYNNFFDDEKVQVLTTKGFISLFIYFVSTTEHFRSGGRVQIVIKMLIFLSQYKYIYKKNEKIKRHRKLTVMSGRDLKARARTRDPWRVYFLQVSTQDGGKSVSLSWIVSGAP